MASRMEIFKISAKHSTTDYSDPNNPTNVSAEGTDNLRDELTTAISGAALTNWNIVHVSEKQVGTYKTSFEVWVEGD